MMLNLKMSEVEDEVFKYLPIGAMIGLIFLFEIFLIVDTDLIPLVGSTEGLNTVDWSNFVDQKDNIEVFGLTLYTHCLVPFLMAGLILLIAMVGAIVLTMQCRPSLRRQHVYQQLSRNFENAVFSVKGSDKFNPKLIG
jgi:NADH-quinone oxidoreductase subunit J